MLEGAVNQKLKSLLNKSGKLKAKKIQVSVGQGVPDIYIYGSGVSGWIEVKVGSNKLSPLQEVFAMEMIEAGVPMFIATYFKETKEIDIRPAKEYFADRKAYNKKSMAILSDQKYYDSLIETMRAHAAVL